jgi:hypothetical protein
VRKDHSDHVHSSYQTPSGSFEPTTDFDYDEVDRGLGWKEDTEGTVSFSDMAAAFNLVLEFVLRGKDLNACGARAAALACYLDPVHSNKFGSTLAEIAVSAGCTRASLSKALIDFRDACGVHFSAGKLEGSRDSYRAAQMDSIERGTHSSTSRKDLHRLRK